MHGSKEFLRLRTTIPHARAIKHFIAPCSCVLTVVKCSSQIKHGLGVFIASNGGVKKQFNQTEKELMI